MLAVLPMETLSLILSFEPPHASRLQILLRVLLGRTSLSSHEADYVFKALCVSSWRSASEAQFEDGWRPNLSSWCALYRVLEQWIPREGLYSVLEAAPWGLLLRVRFHQGKILGELIVPKEESSNSSSSSSSSSTTTTTTTTSTSTSTETTFAIVPVLAVEFGEDGRTSKVTLCGEEISDASIIFGARDEKIKSLRQSPENVVSSRAVTLSAPAASAAASAPGLLKKILNSVTSSTTNAEEAQEAREAREELEAVWNPRERTPSPSEQLIKTLWRAKQTLTLDWIDGPTRDAEFVFESGMPIIQPGLYSGVYHEMYGKFKREVVLIQYRTYQWPEEKNRVRSEVFNVGEHRDRQNIYAGVETRLNNHAKEEETKSSNSSNSGASSSYSVVFILGRKVTGDCHVPMRQLTFGALVHPQISLEGRDARPSSVVDRGGQKERFDVLRGWDGWGTLAYENFQNPGWAPGTLLQVAGMVGAAQESSENHKFAFRWDNGDESGTTSVLTRLKEQDIFQWF